MQSLSLAAKPGKRHLVAVCVDPHGHAARVTLRRGVAVIFPDIATIAGASIVAYPLSAISPSMTAPRFHTPAAPLTPFRRHPANFVDPIDPLGGVGDSVARRLRCQ
jgi:hypothetical protein